MALAHSLQIGLHFLQSALKPSSKYPLEQEQVGIVSLYKLQIVQSDVDSLQSPHYLSQGTQSGTDVD